MDRCDICNGALLFHHKSVPRKCRDNRVRQTVWYECINCGQKIKEEFTIG